MTTTDPATLSSRAAATISAVARVMYPHDSLPDDVYARVARKLAETAGADAAAARMIDEGVAGLNTAEQFEDLAAEARLAAVTAIEGSEFFELVRATAVAEVYSDPRTWQLVGYEGPSFDKGGYINRGFNDLDWLPDPEETP